MIAVIGGGLCGLTAAIRLAEQGAEVALFEAAPELGGRTRSFYEPTIDAVCDNGPHLLAGAYRNTRKLLEDCAASEHIHWQDSLELPLWDEKRGFFTFRPTTWLPMPVALMHAVMKLPGHGLDSALAMLRLGRDLHADGLNDAQTVHDWLARLRIPAGFKCDLLEPLCLGAMNEAPDTALAASFRCVLRESFASHENARLGWFRKPISQALIDPLASRARQLGVTIHKRRRIRSLTSLNNAIQLDGQDYDSAILAMPVLAASRLLGQPIDCETRSITNLHLWFDEDIRLPAAMVGGIGTHGHWFFDISAQMQHQAAKYRHICIVISADEAETAHPTLVSQLVAELQAISAHPSPLSPAHSRIVREKRATTLVRPGSEKPVLPPGIIDACERPRPGDLPATIEAAVLRGEAAAKTYLERN